MRSRRSGIGGIPSPQEIIAVVVVKRNKPLVTNIKFAVRGSQADPDVPVDEHTLDDIPDEMLGVDKMPDEIWRDIPEALENEMKREEVHKPIYKAFPLIDESVRAELDDDLLALLEESEALKLTVSSSDSVVEDAMNSAVGPSERSRVMVVVAVSVSSRLSVTVSVTV